MVVEEDKILALAQELISIPSVTGQEHLLAEFITGYLKEQGLPYLTFQNHPAQPNIVVEMGSRDHSPVCFNCHMDVIPAEDEEAWTHPPFQPTVVGNRLYGRGAVDTKGVVAVCLFLIQELSQNNLACPGGAQFQFVSDEERGGENGSRLVAQRIAQGELARPSLAVIGERSELKLRLADRGCAQFEVTIEGRSSHTAWARAAGINPIYYAAQTIVKLERPLSRYDPALGHPVVSINKIRAGEVINQVPSRCTFTLDFRTILDQSLPEIQTELDNYLKEVCGPIEGLRYTIQLLAYSPASVTSQSSREIERVSRAIARVQGHSQIYVGWAGSTDARFFRELGIPAVVLGPCGGNYHGADEYVELDSIYKLANIYAELIASDLAPDS